MRLVIILKEPLRTWKKLVLYVNIFNIIFMATMNNIKYFYN